MCTNDKVEQKVRELVDFTDSLSLHGALGFRSRHRSYTIADGHVGSFELQESLTDLHDGLVNELLIETGVEHSIPEAVTGPKLREIRIFG